MRVESKSRPESVGRKITESPIGWAVNTAFIVMAWRVAAVSCGFAEIFAYKSCELYYGIRGKLDEMQLRRTRGLNQKGRHG